MTIQDRRNVREYDNGRRTLGDRRVSHDEYHGIERRSGSDRRTIIDRRNQQ